MKFLCIPLNDNLKKTLDIFLNVVKEVDFEDLIVSYSNAVTNFNPMNMLIFQTIGDYFDLLGFDIETLNQWRFPANLDIKYFGSVYDYLKIKQYSKFN